MERPRVSFADEARRRAGADVAANGTHEAEGPSVIASGPATATNGTDSQRDTKGGLSRKGKGGATSTDKLLPAFSAENGGRPAFYAPYAVSSSVQC